MLLRIVAERSREKSADNSQHYLPIFRHYLSLTEYSPSPALLYISSLLDSGKLPEEQLLDITEILLYVEPGRA